MKNVLERLRPGLSCAEVMSVLQTYLDGEIDAKTAAKVTRHLDRCADCGPEADVYRTIMDRLSRRADPIDPEVLDALHQFGNRIASGD